jgi:hypothetical protein
MSRLAKQLIIGGIFLVIVLVPAWLLYRAVVPAATCFDGIQNGNEEGVDCGAAACGVACPPVLQPLQATAPVIFKTGPASFDVLATLNNPNAIYGASRVDYVLTLTDASGQALATRRGTTYANPAQPRYLFFPFTGLSGGHASAQLQFTPTEVQWSALTIEAAGAVQFAVRSDTFTPASASARYEGVVTNRSTFTFDTVDITVLLYDSNGTVVGVNATVMHTLASGEERAFAVDWPFAVPRAVRARAFVTTNIFSNTNFIKTYGSPEKFQSY